MSLIDDGAVTEFGDGSGAATIKGGEGGDLPFEPSIWRSCRK